jgi:hypothetical protein
MLAGAVRALRDGTMFTRDRVPVYGTAIFFFYITIFFTVWLHGNWFRAEDGRLIITDFVQIPAAGGLAAAGKAALVYDRTVFHNAMERVLEHPFDGRYIWRYPPTLLLMLSVPLSFLPYLVAWLVWISATAALFVLSLRLVLPWRLTVPIALGAPASLWCAAVGQNGFLSAALMAATLALLERRPLLAGVCLGCLSFKPQLGLLLPLFLIVDRRWLTFLSATVTVIIIVAGSVAAFGWDSWQKFAASLSDPTDSLLLPDGAFWAKLESFYAIAYQVTGSAQAALAVHVILCLAILPVVVWLWIQPVPQTVKAASVIAATFLFTPYAFTYDSVMLAGSVAFLVRDGLDRGFLSWEKLLLCIAWALPALSGWLGSNTIPLTCLVLLFVAVRRARLAKGAAFSAR